MVGKVEQDDAVSTAVPLTADALSQLGASSSASVTKEGGDDEMETQYSRVSSSRGSATRGPARKAKKLAEQRKRVEASGGVWVEQDEYRSKALTVLMEGDAQVRGSMAKECQANIIQQAKEGPREDMLVRYFDVAAHFEPKWVKGVDVHLFSQAVVNVEVICRPWGHITPFVPN